MPTTCDSDVLRQRMRHLRERLTIEVGHLNGDAQRLLDWRQYVARFPWWTLAAGAALGFWLMPGHAVTQTVKLDPSSLEELAQKNDSSQDREATWMQSLLGLAGHVAWRAAMGYLGHQATQWSIAALRSSEIHELAEAR